MCLLSSAQWQDVMIDTSRGKISSFPSSLSASNSWMLYEKASWHPDIYYIVRTNGSDFTAKWQCAQSKNRFNNLNVEATLKQTLCFCFLAVTWKWQGLLGPRFVRNTHCYMVISKLHNPTYTTRCLMDMYTTNVESAEAFANDSV